jgi:hypothetical protein
VHWITEGKWFGITITEFAYLLGFDEDPSWKDEDP